MIFKICTLFDFDVGRAICEGQNNQRVVHKDDLISDPVIFCMIPVGEPCTYRKMRRLTGPP